MDRKSSERMITENQMDSSSDDDDLTFDENVKEMKEALRKGTVPTVPRNMFVPRSAPPNGDRIRILTRMGTKVVLE